MISVFLFVFLASVNLGAKDGRHGVVDLSGTATTPETALAHTSSMTTTTEKDLVHVSVNPEGSIFASMDAKNFLIMFGLSGVFFLIWVLIIQTCKLLRKIFCRDRTYHPDDEESSDSSSSSDEEISEEEVAELQEEANQFHPLMLRENRQETSKVVELRSRVLPRCPPPRELPTHIVQSRLTQTNQIDVKLIPLQPKKFKYNPTAKNPLFAYDESSL